MPVFLGAALSAGAFVGYAAVKSEGALTVHDERRIVVDLREYTDRQTAILRSDLQRLENLQLQMLAIMRQKESKT